MTYIESYASPFGEIVLGSDGDALTGLWFRGQKYFGTTLTGQPETKDLPVFRETARWLDVYFEGRQPDFLPPLLPQGTAFQKEIWVLLQKIPYGTAVTYGALAAAYAAEKGRVSMSAQAVGGAVGRNPISILIPCHRVLGAQGSLTGYAGGLELKRSLLQLEGLL